MPGQKKESKAIVVKREPEDLFGSAPGLLWKVEELARERSESARQLQQVLDDLVRSREPSFIGGAAKLARNEPPEERERYVRTLLPALGVVASNGTIEAIGDVASLGAASSLPQY
jgi:hypothetical protein